MSDAADEGTAGGVATLVDDRLPSLGFVRRSINKVFPDHWSFMIGEIALYSFIILLLTGTYLTFFFDAVDAGGRLQRLLRAAARA